MENKFEYGDTQVKVLELINQKKKELFDSDNYDKYGVLTKYFAIELNYGRAWGQTTLIARESAASDLVLVSTIRDKRSMVELGCKAEIVCGHHELIKHELRGKMRGYKVIWVDNPHLILWGEGTLSDIVQSILNREIKQLWIVFRQITYDKLTLMENV
jgi:hypothetical protein